jgi:DNA-binding LacI/PurR family transcriptional regulator
MSRSQQRSTQPTIKRIAEEAGVSISTVSNVLNQNTDQMSEDTLVRVQEVIQRLNYRPNQIARGLVTRRTATLGLILAEIETPLFLQAITSVERHARSAGYSLLLLHARDVQEEQEAQDLLLEKQVDGVIFLSTSERKDDVHLHVLKEASVPVVLVNRSTRHAQFDQVNWDNGNGVVEAVEHLTQLGHRRIATLLGAIARSGTQDRLQGYRLGLERNRIAYREEYVQNGDYTASPELWRDATRALISLPEPPTAIIASDDTVAAVVVQTVEEASLDVPNAISVVGIDDQPFLSFLSLTTVKLPVVEAGMHAIEMLIRRIADPDIPVEHVMLPCPLIIRRSTGPAPHANTKTHKD